MPPFLFYFSPLFQGLKFRVYFGALLSLLDLWTDIETIVRFFEEGNTNFAYANLVFIAGALLLHLMATVFQNRHRGKKVITYEVLIVLFMLKPAWDAKKIASGDEKAKNAPLTPQTESTLTKVSY